MQKHLARGAILASALALTACASGSFNGLGKDPMAMLMVHKNPLYNEGEVTAGDYALVTKLATACKRDKDRQVVSIAETMGTSAGANAFGGTFLGPAAKAGFGDAVRLKDYTPYGAVANAGAGLVQGAQIQSFNSVSLIGNCTNGDLQDPLARKKVSGGGGLHVYPSIVRTTNSSKAPPSWVKPASAVSAIPAPTDTQLEDSFTAPAAAPPM